MNKYAKLCRAEGIVSDRVRTTARENTEGPREKPQRWHKKKTSELSQPSQRIGPDEGITAPANLAEKKQKELIRTKKNQKKNIILARTTRGQPLLSKVSSLFLEKLSEEKKGNHHSD